jgi:hypothetical protein
MMPDPIKLDLLIRTTLIALNQANATGNYAVFRELGAPGFQMDNSSGRLSEIFSGLRKKNLDLSPIIFVQPQLFRQPAFENGLLRLTGFFPTQPSQVNFDLMFQDVNGAWLLFGISMNTTEQIPMASAVPQANTSTGSVNSEHNKEKIRNKKRRPGQKQVIQIK